LVLLTARSNRIHFEKQTFANGTTVTAATNPLGVVVNPTYYGFTVTGAAASATVAAVATDGTNDGVRNYAGAIGYNAGAYDTIVCQSDDVNGTATAAATAGVASCSAGIELN
jgi:type IV pilus assembly protein PilA